LIHPDTGSVNQSIDRFIDGWMDRLIHVVRE